MATVTALKPRLAERPATTLFMHLGSRVMLIATLPQRR
jgi:hypothetical protein